MTVKDLIIKLLDCPMDAEVRIKTSNKDKENCNHIYDKVEVDTEPIIDVLSGISKSEI